MMGSFLSCSIECAKINGLGQECAIYAGASKDGIHSPDGFL